MVFLQVNDKRSWHRTRRDGAARGTYLPGRISSIRPHRGVRSRRPARWSHQAFSKRPTRTAPAF